MSDKEARILGAGSSIEIDGKEYKLSPITMKQLMEVQREAVSYYKRQYLQTFVENASILPNGDRLLEKKLEEVARWDVKDCPPRTAYDCSLVVINEEIKQKIRTESSINQQDEPETDSGWRALLASLLDREKITPGEVEQLSNIKPYRNSIPYDLWWTTGTWEGAVSYVYQSFKIAHPNITKDQVAALPFVKLVQAARIVSQVTAPEMGNT